MEKQIFTSIYNEIEKILKKRIEDAVAKSGGKRGCIYGTGIVNVNSLHLVDIFGEDCLYRVFGMLEAKYGRYLAYTKMAELSKGWWLGQVSYRMPIHSDPYFEPIEWFEPDPIMHKNEGSMSFGTSNKQLCESISTIGIKVSVCLNLLDEVNNIDKFIESLSKG